MSDFPYILTPRRLYSALHFTTIQTHAHSIFFLTGKYDVTYNGLLGPQK